MITGTALNTATKALLEVCSRRGISTADLLANAKLSPDLFERYNGRIPIDKKRIIWEDAQRRTSDEHIGLLAAETVPFGGYGIFDYFLFASSTLGEVLERSSRFYRLINSNAELQLQTSQDYLSVEVHNRIISSPKLQGLSAEYAFAVVLLRLRMAVGSKLKPESVCFSYPSPENVSAHQRIFHSPLRFNQSANRLIFPRDVLDVPLPQADPALAEMLEHHAQRLLRQLPAEDDITGEVREVLLTTLRGGNVTLNATARTLAMSGRSLQRKLNGQGTSYRRLLDKIRYELALDFISRQVDAQEIAYQLGFSETSAFYRAFKRWSENNSDDFLKK
jgi:AraC-like DNA-binding protein